MLGRASLIPALLLNSAPANCVTSNSFVAFLGAPCRMPWPASVQPF